ncbi:MAG: low temperature requirement protein A [Burkholderiales bacterium]|nr:low temperature requirement protein A [Burkholderiales bacterium]
MSEGSHRLRPLRGRDADEAGRAATPLETLFDLSFVIGFAFAGQQFAHYLNEGHWRTACVGFGFSMFAIIWAWTNFSWFSSAFDNDDWIFRLATMVQMVGVIVLALGLRRMFASIDGARGFDNGVMVLGYVVMRVALMAQWLRAARHDARHRSACLVNAATLFVAQIGWVLWVRADFGYAWAFALTVPLLLVEMAGPLLAELRFGGIPWHAHHIAERYLLLAIIALGEVVTGSVEVVSGFVGRQGWSADAVALGAVGIALAFGMWWIYGMIPAAAILKRHRRAAFVWAYAQTLLLVAIAATGAGLQVAGHAFEHGAAIGLPATVLTVALPVAVYVFTVYALYSWLTHSRDRFHLLLLGATAAVLGAVLALAWSGAPLGLCLGLLVAVPAITIVGYETLGYRHQARALERLGLG